jgi:hypothetical protein
MGRAAERSDCGVCATARRSARDNVAEDLKAIFMLLLLLVMV